MSIQRSQVIPSFRDLKQQILPRNPNFQPSTVLPLDTANRTTGTPINNPSWSIPVPVKGAYAVSLKSLAMPVSWPNVTSTKHFDVEYGQVTPFPGDFTLGIGRYSYNLYAGKITYTMANEAPIDLYQDDLIHTFLRWFSGAIESITIDPPEFGPGFGMKTPKVSLPPAKTYWGSLKSIIRAVGYGKAVPPSIWWGPKSLLYLVVA